MSQAGGSPVLDALNDEGTILAVVAMMTVKPPRRPAAEQGTRGPGPMVCEMALRWTVGAEQGCLQRAVGRGSWEVQAAGMRRACQEAAAKIRELQAQRGEPASVLLVAHQAKKAVVPTLLQFLPEAERAVVGTWRCLDITGLALSRGVAPGAAGLVQLGVRAGFGTVPVKTARAFAYLAADCAHSLAREVGPLLFHAHSKPCQLPGPRGLLCPHPGQAVPPGGKDYVIKPIAPVLGKPGAGKPQRAPEPPPERSPGWGSAAEIHEAAKGFKPGKSTRGEGPTTAEEDDIEDFVLEDPDLDDYGLGEETEEEEGSDDVPDGGDDSPDEGSSSEGVGGDAGELAARAVGNEQTTRRGRLSRLPAWFKDSVRLG